MSLVNAKFEKLHEVFTVLKNIKSELVVIPRDIIQTRYDRMIMGISNDSVVSIGKYDSLESIGSLWNNDNLTYIAADIKDIKNLMKFYNAQSNISLDYLIKTHDYILNNEFISIAYKLELRSQGSCIYEMELIPYTDILHKCLFMYNLSLQGLPVMDIEVTNDENFKKIVDAKASDGSILWTPIYGYTISMPSTLMAINKDDKIMCNIRDGLSIYQFTSFLVHFKIHKTKNKCIIDVYMLVLKI